MVSGDSGPVDVAMQNVHVRWRIWGAVPVVSVNKP
jgi:hypothetical protein